MGRGSEDINTCSVHNLEPEVYSLFFTTCLYFYDTTYVLSEFEEKNNKIKLKYIKL